MNPTKIVDIVTGKKAPQIKTDDEDNPLELLPEKRSKMARKIPKNVSNENSQNFSQSADPGSLFTSLSFLIDDLKLLNYSSVIEEHSITSKNSLDKAVHDLFADEDMVEKDQEEC